MILLREDSAKFGRVASVVGGIEIEPRARTTQAAGNCHSLHLVAAWPVQNVWSTDVSRYLKFQC